LLKQTILFPQAPGLPGDFAQKTSYCLQETRGFRFRLVHFAAYGYGLP